MKWKIARTKRFEKNLKRCVLRGYSIEDYRAVANKLEEGKPLPPHCKPHKLSGELDGCWDCHIKFDWVLIYRYDYKNKTLTFEDTGTHSDLFG